MVKEFVRLILIIPMFSYLLRRYSFLFYRGKKIDTSVDEQKVTIVYDSKKTDYDDFVTAFRKIGYEIKRK